MIKALVRNRISLISLCVLVLIASAALLAPALPIPHPSQQSLMESLMPPSLAHPLGTDEFGRDLMARIVYGARLALVMALLSVFGAVVLGTIIGVTSGFVGGVLDSLLMRAMDMIFAFPYLLIAIGIVTALGPGALNAALAIAVWLTPSAARVARSATLDLKHREFVESSRALGSHAVRLILRHIIPNMSSTLIIFITVAIGRAIIMDASLSFLGLGAQPPTPTWGNMVSDGRTYLLVAPHLALVPGVAILVTVLSFNLLGDGIKEALNPKLR